MKGDPAWELNVKWTKHAPKGFEYKAWLRNIYNHDEVAWGVGRTEDEAIMEAFRVIRKRYSHVHMDELEKEA